MTKSRKKNVFLNIIFGYIVQLGMIVLSFVGRRIFLNYLSVEYLGINGLFSNILTILSLPELGVDSAVVYFLYKPVADDDKNLIVAMLKYFKKLYTYLAVAIFLIGIAFIPFLQYIIKSDLPSFDLIVYYVLFLINSVISYLVAHKVALLSANQKQRVQKTAMLFSNIILQFIHIAVLMIWKNYVLYIVATIIGTVINNVILSIVCKKLYAFEDVKSNATLEKKIIVTKIASTFVYKIGAVIINSTDNILISTIVSTAAVGLYSNYYTVVSAFNGLLAIITKSLISSVGNLSATEEKRKQYEYFNFFILFYHFIAALGAIGFYLLINDFIAMWIGNNYLFDKYVVFSIVFNFYLTNAINPIWMFREANGLFEKVKYLILTTAFLNIFLSIILGKIFGIFGILTATALSRIMTNVWYEPRVLFNNVFMTNTSLYWKNQCKYLMLSIISFLLSWLIIKQLPSSLLFFIVKGMLITGITTTVFFIGTCKTKEFSMICGIIKSNDLRTLIKKEKSGSTIV